MKEHTRRTALTALSVIALGVVVLAPAAASWHGLVATGRELFGLRDGWELVVPLTLDGAALYSAALAFRAILATDSAFGARLLTAVYALAAAGFQFVHKEGNTAAGLFFAGASVSAVVLWDVTLRALRRDQLRALGAVERPLPRFRLLRWLVAPIETARAWRLAVLEQISDPAEALASSRVLRGVEPRRVRAERITEPTPALEDAQSDEGDSHGESNDDADESWRRSDQDGVHAARAAGGADDRHQHAGGCSGSGAHGLGLARVSSGIGDDVSARAFRLIGTETKKEAVRAAFAHLGRKDVPAALALLQSQGLYVDRSYAYTVEADPTPSLRVVGDQR